MTRTQNGTRGRAHLRRWENELDERAAVFLAKENGWQRRYDALQNRERMLEKLEKLEALQRDTSKAVARLEQAVADLREQLVASDSASEGSEEEVEQVEESRGRGPGLDWWLILHLVLAQTLAAAVW